jgi:predicted phosphodiesterase
MNITRKWKRLIAVGCSHGVHIDPHAERAVLRFRQSYKPHTVVHLGDFCDTTAFRSGAKGTSDESASVSADVDGGLGFLMKLEPTIVFCGNHEARTWRFMDSSNAIISDCATRVVEEIRGTARRLKAELIEYTGVWQLKKIGNYSFFHGSIYNESATRDNAEIYGNCVHAHTHRAAVAKGRRIDNPTGFCVGTLTNVPNMDYASTRRATLGWSAGIVFGEYCDDLCQFYLHEQPRGLTEWRLPT